MDATRFDQLTRRLGRRLTRRAALGTFVAAAVATALPGSASAINPCLDITVCKSCRWNMMNGATTCMTIGDIPGGPYEQEWRWTPLPMCYPKNHTESELGQICNDTYACKPGDDPFKLCCAVDPLNPAVRDCNACASFRRLGATSRSIPEKRQGRR